jgi:hypothetical protein
VSEEEGAAVSGPSDAPTESLRGEREDIARSARARANEVEL